MKNHSEFLSGNRYSTWLETAGGEFCFFFFDFFSGRESKGSCRRWQRQSRAALPSRGSRRWPRRAFEVNVPLCPSVLPILHNPQFYELWIASRWRAVETGKQGGQRIRKEGVQGRGQGLGTCLASTGSHQATRPAPSKNHRQGGPGPGRPWSITVERASILTKPLCPGAIHNSVDRGREAGGWDARGRTTEVSRCWLKADIP